MIIFVDASALVALMTDEPGSFELAERLDRADDRLCSPLAMWETVRAVARKRRIGMEVAYAETLDFAGQFGIRIVPIVETDGALAARAEQLYGKSAEHPANLNMGDCFAYACAKNHGAELLYKGNDFIHTDLA